MESLAGPLWEGVLPGVLRQLYVGRASGRLVLERDAVRYGLRFGRGHILNAETSARPDRMGQLLVTRGVLTEHDLKRATGFALRDRKRLGVVLLEHGLLDAQGVADAVAAHVQHVLDRVFAWNEGHYTFQEEAEPAPEEGGLTLRLSTGDLILQAAHSVSDPDVVRYNLGDLDRRLALSSDPLLRFQHVSLSPVDGYLLSRVDGTLSARSVISLIPLPEVQVHRSLFGLVCAGVVDFLPAEPKRRPGSAAETPAAGPAQPSVAPEAALELRAAPPPPVPPLPAAAEKTRPMPALDRRRLEILGCHASLERASHFELLGVARDATAAQVREAYAALARRFHPDAHHEPSLSDLRDPLEQIFARLGEAYEVLCQPRLRAQYEEQLDRADAGRRPPRA
jgi:hypothetical protein